MTRGDKSKKAQLKKAARMSSMAVPVDREKYSDASKRSEGWYHLPDEYQDIHYECQACGTTAVWSRREQKSDFEEKGRYIWQRRVLCQSCFRRKTSLQGVLNDRQKIGASAELSVKELTAWAEEMREYERLGGRRSAATWRMIEKRKRLQQCPRP